MTSFARVVGSALGIVVIGACSSGGGRGVGRGVSGPSALAVAAPVHVPTPVTGGGADPALIDRRVFVEGDSLTVGITEPLSTLLDSAGWTVILDAQVGRTTAEGITLLSEHASEFGGTLVVALGTNDPPDPTLFAQHIDEVMQLASGRRVIWVTVARSGWDVLDVALIAAQLRWPNLRVIDWRPIIAAQPMLRAADGIHLTLAGYQLRAAFVAQAVEVGG